MNRIIIIGGRIHTSNSAATARVRNYIYSLSRNNSNEIYLVSLSEDDITLDFIQDPTTPNLNVLPAVKKGAAHIRISDVWKFFNSLQTRIPEIKRSAFIFYPQVNSKLEIIFLIWAKIHGIKNIYCEINEVRKYWAALPTFGFIKRSFYKLSFAISERLSKSYRGLVCINHNIQEYYSKYNDNALVIPILSPIGNIQASDKIRSSLPLKIAFTGSVDIEKENLIELFKGLSLFDKTFGGEWSIDFYGYYQEGMSRRINKITTEYGIADRVILNGMVNHADIPDILSSADCLILPRENNKQNFYGFSTKLSEYLVSGTPVILTRTGVTEEYLTDGVDCIFVNGYDADGFCKALLRLTGMSDTDRKIMCENATKTARKCFAPEIYTDQFTDFLFS